MLKLWICSISFFDSLQWIYMLLIFCSFSLSICILSWNCHFCNNFLETFRRGGKLEQIVFPWNLKTWPGNCSEKLTMYLCELLFNVVQIWEHKKNNFQDWNLVWLLLFQFSTNLFENVCGLMLMINFCLFCLFFCRCWRQTNM